VLVDGIRRQGQSAVKKKCAIWRQGCHLCGWVIKRQPVQKVIYHGSGKTVGAIMECTDPKVDASAEEEGSVPRCVFNRISLSEFVKYLQTIKAVHDTEPVSGDGEENATTAAESDVDVVVDPIVDENESTDASDEVDYFVMEATVPACMLREVTKEAEVQCCDTRKPEPNPHQDGRIQQGKTSTFANFMLSDDYLQMCKEHDAKMADTTLPLDGFAKLGGLLRDMEMEKVD
jgi:hypothetical protein